MSRTRFVKGKIFETVGGNLQYYSEANITESASETYAEKSSEKILQAGNPERYQNKLENSIKGLAIFRRKNNYSSKPDFGFDWYAGNNYGTTYNEPFNYDDDKTLVSGRDKLKKEYASVIQYMSIRKFGYIEAGKNKGRSIISIMDKNYFVPWFSGFAKDEGGNSKSYELDVFFNIEEPAEGSIKISSKNESIEVVFTDDNDISFNINESHPKQFSKTVKISFLDYITEDSTIIISFHKKSEEEKVEEQKQKESQAEDQTSNSISTVFVTAGELMGILNIYKNSIEYNVVFRYVKVFFKGWVYVENIKDKVYVSGASNGYQEDENLIEKERNLTRGIANLKTLRTSIIVGGNAERIRQNQDLIRKQESELLSLKSVMAQRKLISTALYNEQLGVMNNKEIFISNNKSDLINMFSQPLIRYKEKAATNYEQLEIDVKEMDSFFDDLKLKKSGASHFIVDDDDEEANSGRIRNKINKAFKSRETKDKKELIVFLLPFGIISNVKNGLILLGQAEDVSYNADSAMLTPQADASTFIHEAGHTFNLPHTFLKRDGGWFSEGIKIEQGTTDNIMDYSYNLKNKDSNPSNNVNVLADKFALWKFQWDIMRKDPNLVEIVKK
ncbi:reprolysin-like metallopeptidase [Chryseobacterium turcicum]|uniref:Uncharacterized protein n=1 Tax=Chryseobacterium turcicum TaxID=2898076 RepID=A0A9Q3V1G6_9FLAO|nr:hypothetical protein [Chryseobacterium turcicum]MCD1116402.1 hypothetical protein [Chryseobacterium turcicum]